jgi:DNA repair protein RadC
MSRQKEWARQWFALSGFGDGKGLVPKRVRTKPFPPSKRKKDFHGGWEGAKIYGERVMYQETYIREIRIQYHCTGKPLFTLKSPQAAHDFIRSVLPDNSREHCIALYLNAAHEVICYSQIATGTADAATVSPREIFQRALVAGAVALLFAHNHPSGQVNPSAEDIRLTKRIREAGELLGVKLLDHLIVSDDACYSFEDNGML